MKTGNPGWEAFTDSKQPIMRWGEKESHIGKPSGLKLIYTMFTNKAVGE